MYKHTKFPQKLQSSIIFYTTTIYPTNIILPALRRLMQEEHKLDARLHGFWWKRQGKEPGVWLQGRVLAWMGSQPACPPAVWDPCSLQTPSLWDMNHMQTLYKHHNLPPDGPPAPNYSLTLAGQGMADFK